MKGFELLSFSRPMSISVREKISKLALNSLANGNSYSTSMVTVGDDNEMKCSRGQHFKTITFSKQIPIQPKHNLMASSLNAMYKPLESSQGSSSSNFCETFHMIRMYHTSPNRNESVGSNPQHHNEKYVDTPQKNDSNKGKLQDAAKRGSNLAKKGALSVRDLIRKYGWTFVGTYGSLYLLTLSSLFAGIDSGYLDPTILTDIQFPWVTGTSEGLESSTTLDNKGTDEKEAASAVQMISAYLESYELTKPYAKAVEENVHLTNLAIAWVATKVTEPIRLGLTVAILPRVSKFFQPSQTKSEGEEK